MHHELGLTNNSSDIETTPYHGENELKEGVLEALEKSCQTIREFQQEQYAELMKLINSEALKLARLQFPENMRELSITMRNKKAVDEHEAAGELFRQDKSDDNKRNDLIKADMARRYAHNAVARDFKKIFGLNHPDGTPYAEKDYRELITEMFVTDRQNEQ